VFFFFFFIGKGSQDLGLHVQEEKKTMSEISMNPPTMITYQFCCCNLAATGQSLQSKNKLA